MNKGQFVEYIAQKTGESAKDTKVFVDAFWETVVEQLKKGEKVPVDGIVISGKTKVSLTGIGTFCLKKRPSRRGVNPLTQKRIVIPAKTVVNFKPSQSLTDRVNV